ncbi:MAG: vWA domain-containing protein [Nocardioidaceae bacterium]
MSRSERSHRGRDDRFRYGLWRGGDDPLAAPFDVRSALDDLGRDVLEGQSVAEAMRAMMRRGADGRRGLDDLRREVQRRRRRLERSGNLAGTIDRVRAALDQVLAAERETLAGEPDDVARLAEMTLDDLPPDTAGAVRELASYEFHSDEARAGFEQIQQMLRREVLVAQFAGMRATLSGNDPEAMERIRAMLADLNSLLAAHARGEDTPQQFDEFMDRHGEFFPENPGDVDDLIDLLARRQDAAERMMRSLTSAQRAELDALMSEALGDVDLESQLAQLHDNLSALRPGLGRGRPADIDGAEPLGYSDAVGAVADLADLEALSTQLGQDYPGANLDDVDVEALERHVSPATVEDLQALRELEAQLERQGYLRRGVDGLALTPKALRRLGETALRRIFTELDAHAQADHDDQRTGAADERTGAFLTWHFGDERPIDAVHTVHNAVLRSAGEGLDTSDGVRLAVDDFEVAETERRTGAAVALCVDLSFSMIQEDRWGPMKQTALALSHLIATRFRQDALQIIGFDRLARRLSALELAEVEPEWVQGTNLQHALMIAERHVRRHPDEEPVVLVVTDGEPTAHLEPDGSPTFSWPTTPATLRATVGQVDTLTRYGATLNFFMLGDDPGLARFVDAVARRNGGRVFTPELGRLGEYVVADYLRVRRGRRRTA